MVLPGRHRRPGSMEDAKAEDNWYTLSGNFEYALAGCRNSSDIIRAPADRGNNCFAKAPDFAERYCFATRRIRCIFSRSIPGIQSLRKSLCAKSSRMNMRTLTRLVRN